MALVILEKTKTCFKGKSSNKRVQSTGAGSLARLGHLLDVQKVAGSNALVEFVSTFRFILISPFLCPHLKYALLIILALLINNRKEREVYGFSTLAQGRLGRL
jgi:hypothetical protein